MDLPHKKPIFRVKQPIPNPEELLGILRLRYATGGQVWLDTYYTRLDQALVVWGGVTAVIFLTAQFGHLTWTMQALVWSILSLSAITTTSRLAWHWASVKQVRWVVIFWALLILGGICLTDYGVFLARGSILINLCPIWLGLCVLGYGITSVGMRSLALTFISLIHLCAITLLRLVPEWQFLLTGTVIAGSLLVLAVWQWEHR
jgi:hypothetical protein